MTDSELAVRFFLQLAVILLACRLVGWIAIRAGQPPVVAEMVTGFLLGPSLLGLIAPDLFATLFPRQTLGMIFLVSQLGLVLYMFCVGLEFNTQLMLQNSRRAAAVSIGGVVVPFAFGSALALWLVPAGGFFSEQVRPFQAVLFVGASMAITAFPMLARIIYERGISGTALGTLVLTAGAINDAAAWIILAIVIGSLSGSNMLAAAAALGAVFYVALVYVVVRPFFRKLSAAAEAEGHLPAWIFSTVLVVLAMGAWFTDTVGIHSVFGAFVLGAGMPRGIMSRELQRMVGPVTTALLVPLFFVYSGLNSQIGLLNSPWLWLVTVLVFAIACAGKGLGCWLAARLTGATNREAMAVGTLMNARGMMELILLNIGLQRGLITPTLFTILVMMAIGTTLMASPLFSLLYRREPAVSTDSQMATETS
jgi:Kef-type K+ transport system membrane component KefB